MPVLNESQATDAVMNSLQLGFMGALARPKIQSCIGWAYQMGYVVYTQPQQMQKHLSPQEQVMVILTAAKATGVPLEMVKSKAAPAVSMMNNSGYFLGKIR